MNVLLLSLVLVLQCVHVLATQKCVWVVGKVECAANPLAVLSTEIRVLDRDGPRPGHILEFIDGLDRDDQMGLGYPDINGNFRVEGCTGDHDWLPWIPNDSITQDPEPYVVVYHFCAPEDETVQGVEKKIKEFRTFAPEVYNMTREYGVIKLDNL